MSTETAQPQREYLTSDRLARAIISAAREEFVQFGIRRANMEAIARRAGISRVTVYRRFESKKVLFRAVVLADVAVFMQRFDRLWYGDAPLRRRVGDLCIFCVRQLRGYPLLTTLLRADADEVLPLLSIDGREEFEILREMFQVRIQALNDRGELANRDPERTAELLVRLGYSAALLPFGLLPGDSDEEIRRTGEDLILPILQGSR
jgi:TetR/AcrR family transcriptional repressor of uid operon